MAPNYGVTLTTPGGNQAHYHTVIYTNPATITSAVLNDQSGAGVLGTVYVGTVFPPPAIPSWTLANLGTITAQQAIGVVLLNGGSVSNAPTVAGGGIFGAAGGVAIQASIGTVTNFGTIVASGTGAGVNLSAGGAVRNGATNSTSAAIGGYSNGVLISGASGSVGNYGSIDGNVGVYLAQGGQLVNGAFNTLSPAAVIAGVTAGAILAQHASTVFNTGSIAGGIGIQANTGAAATILNNGTIVGTTTDGIYLKSGGLISNTTTLGGGGTIQGVTGGILSTGASVTVDNDGTISATRYNATAINLADGLIFNQGTIKGGTGIAANGTLRNTTGALIAGSQTYSSSFAVRLNGYVRNDGSITGGAGLSDNEGVVGTVTIVPTLQNGGLISGTYAAVSIRDFGTASPLARINNGDTSQAGTILGGDYGLAISSANVMVNNYGTIKANGGVYPTRIATGLALSFATGSVYNGRSTSTSAYVFGRNIGVYLQSSDISVANYGTIKGRTGIVTYGGTTHANAVDNFGTIIGTGGNAISFGRGNSHLTIEPGAVFVGSVIGGSGTNTLRLASGSAAGTVTGIGNTFANFNDIYIDTNATWFVDGSDFVNLTGKGGNVHADGTLNIRSGGVFSNFGSMYGGVTLQSGATLTNSQGSIENSDKNAVVVAGTAAVVHNYATITVSGSAGSGLALSAAGTVVSGTRFAGKNVTIAGVNYGISASVTAPLTVTNFGTITGAVGIRAGNTASIANGPSGGTAALISGGSSGVVMTDGGTLSNFGTIEGTANRGVRAGTISATIVNGAPTGTAALITGGNVGIDIDSGTVTNYGSVTGDFAVSMQTYDVLVNGPSGAAAALLAGNTTGIYARDHSTITNFATITGTGNVGIAIIGSGTISNAGTGALISGGTAGIYVSTSHNATASIDNMGTITSPGTGVDLFFGQSTLNNGNALSPFAVISGGSVGVGDDSLGLTGDEHRVNNYGTIIGGTGIKFSQATTLTNYGTIIGTSGIAIAFGDKDDLLTEQPSGLIAGIVNGGAGKNGIILGDSVAAVGTLTGFGASIVNFSSIQVQSGGTWRLAGNSTISAPTSLYNYGTVVADASDNLQIASPVQVASFTYGVLRVQNAGTLGLLNGTDPNEFIQFAGSVGDVLQLDNIGAQAGTIQFFSAGDTIDLVHTTANTAGWFANKLTIESGGIPVGTLNLNGNFASAHFVVATDSAGTGTAITIQPVACFAAGTRIATRRGDVAVEDLAVDDVVWAQFAGWTRVQWLGHRRIDCLRHPRPRRVWPVRIAADAFGHGRPYRELFLSPDHAVFVDDVLIPIMHLINGTTIRQIECSEVTYHHIELPRHDVVLAEGLPTESYLDTGDRANFVNGGGAVVLHPEFAVRTWEAAGCAPLIVSGPQLVAARRWVNALDRRQVARAG